jgi:hypothetical protein
VTSTAAETRIDSTRCEQSAADSAVTVVSFGTVALLSLAQRASLPDSALGIGRDGRIIAENQRFDRAFHAIVDLPIPKRPGQMLKPQAVRDVVPCPPVYQTRLDGFRADR